MGHYFLDILYTESVFHYICMPFLLIIFSFQLVREIFQILYTLHRIHTMVLISDGDYELNAHERKKKVLFATKLRGGGVRP